MARSPLVFFILDGFANNPNPKGNAVKAASTPNLDRVFSGEAYTELETSGVRVGLPAGQMGNSEVGHLNIGAGRVVKQELLRINEAVEDGSLAKLPELRSAFEALKADPSKALHLIGLTSAGGVHSNNEHLKALIEAAEKSGVANVFVHAITDGRDRPPTAAKEELGDIQKYIQSLASDTSDIRIASIIGRYFAMDRDNRWERVKKAYDLFVMGKGDHFEDPISALEHRYQQDQSDEFIEAISLGSGKNRESLIGSGDTLLFFNFRADRMREILASFLAEQVSFSGFPLDDPPQLSSILTLTEYEEGLPVEVLFKPVDISNHFGATIAKAGLRQLRVAETEKYPHVTYFFNGGDEQANPEEERLLIPSPKEVATYDLKPEMSAYELTEQLLAALESEKFDVVVCNFANCDMVGHTGNFEAAVKAVETVDACIGKLLAKIEAKQGYAVITADHGNADQMIDYETGGPHTFHTTYPVPFAIVGRDSIRLRKGGALCDIAPTLLDLLGLDKPELMTGTSLVV